MKDELADVSSSVGDLIARVRKLEAMPASSSTAAAPSKELTDLLNSLDPAKCRAAFIGFGDGLDEQRRAEEIEKVMQQYSAHRFKVVGHFYKGGRGARKLSKVSFVEFASEEARANFVKAVGDKKFSIGGQQVSVKNALTKVNAKRNYSLRSACDLIKADAKANGKTVELKWSDRSVVVDSVAVFGQDRHEVCGKFLGEFAHLSLA